MSRSVSVRHMFSRIAQCAGSLLLSVALASLTCLPASLPLAGGAQGKFRFYHPDHLGSTNASPMSAASRGGHRIHTLRVP